MTKDPSLIPVASNIDKPILKVVHSALKSSQGSVFRKYCPLCGNPSLLVTRDKETLKVADYDRCQYCGQLYRYTDFNELKKIAGEE